MEDYEPYGPEWEREVGRLTKAQLITMLAQVGKERDRLALRLGRLVAIIKTGDRATVAERRK